MEEPNTSIWLALRLHSKREQLKEEFACFLASWQEEGMRLSDVLKAIALLARSESNKPVPEKPQWTTVAILLEAAAIEAETPGRELP